MQEENYPAVHIMANRYRGTIYTGVTTGLYNGVWEYKNEILKGFTSKAWSEDAGVVRTPSLHAGCNQAREAIESLKARLENPDRRKDEQRLAGFVRID